MAGTEHLNLASREEAFEKLHACCASLQWARRMVSARPFDGLDSTLATAERIWWELRPNDWLEAFASHPKIGERQAKQIQSDQSAQWSEAEQAGTRSAECKTLDALAEANQAYENQFGYTYIVCATGKSAEEMLAICQARLSNDPETELRTAAAEQQKITELRLKKLIEATE